MAENNTTATPALPFSDEPLALSALYIVISVIIIFENVLGIFVIFVNTKLHSTTYIFVSSMAITDVGAGVFSLLAHSFHVFDTVNNGQDTDINLSQSIAAGCFYSFMMVSIAHMALISWERYIFITRPFFYKRRCNMSTTTIVLTVFWILSGAFVGLLFYAGLNKIALYDEDMPVNEAYVAGISLYLTSVAVTGVAYGLISKLAWSRKRAKAKNTSSHLPHQEESWKDILKTIKFFILVYGIFLLFTVPLFVSFATHYISREVPSLVLVTTSSLSVLDSGVNFLVLYVLNEEFRLALNKTVFKICRRH